MRVLFVSGACPYPPDSGGTVRTYNLLKRLAERHEITLVTPERPGTDLEAAFGFRLRRIVQIPTSRRTPARSLRALASPLPYIVKAHQSEQFSSAVAHALASDRFDLLHCDSISAVPAIPTNARLPKVFNAHNIEARIWERYLQEERRPWMLPVLKSQLAKVRTYETLLSRLFDCCAAVSEEDCGQMARYGFPSVCLVRNGVDLGYYDPLPDQSEPNLVFVGSLDWRPNQDGLRWFSSEIWPLVRTAIPGAKLSVVGRRPPRWVSDLCRQDGIRLHADAPDVRPHLAAASVAVVPLRIGGGSRLKILEAMAAGRAVVSTSIGAEGLETRPGQHLLTADDPASFAKSAVFLLHNPLRREELAQAGRVLVEERYSWDRIALDLEAAWHSAARDWEVSR